MAGAPSSYSGRVTRNSDVTRLGKVADKLPRIARTDICRGIIAQFYASDFWNATRAL